MTGQQLKNSILQMAVQGKLVPQDPNDEPARFLLERIRKEKERLVREKIIKPEKNPSVIFRGADNLPYEKRGKDIRCIADEIPFEIPDSWEWARLGSVIELQSGQDLTPDKYNAEHHGIPYITGASNIDSDKVIINRWTEYPRAFAYYGELLLTCKGTVGSMAILHVEKVHIARQIMAIHPINGIEMDFLKIVIESFVDELQSAAKSMIPGISREDILTALLPIPPQEEQRRIINQFKYITPLIAEYGAKEAALSELNTSLPSLLKKSILQEALQGKLVPQDPNDEPARFLLERIRKEKARLVKEGKLKPGKHESVIFRRDNSHYEKLDGKERCIDDKIPFEIPENWEWVRLNSLCFSIADGDHQPPPQVATGVPFLVISNVSTGHLDFKNVRHVPQQYFNELAASRKPKKGDLLFTVTGSFGIVIPIEDDTDFCFQRHMALLKMPKYLASIWLAKWLQSPMVLEKCKEEATGTAQKTVGLNTLRSLILPVPPLAEQGRILRQLSTLMYMLTNQ